MNLPSQDAIAQFQTLDSNYTAGLRHWLRRHHSHGAQVRKPQSTTASSTSSTATLPTTPTTTSSTSRANHDPKFQLNMPGGNIGGPLWIPHVYNEAKNRTFFFWNEEWRRLIQGQRAFGRERHSGRPTSRRPGANLAYTAPTGKTAYRSFQLPNEPSQTAT